MTARIGVPVTTVWSSADAPRPQDAPIVAAEPDPLAWNAALLDAPPSALHGRTVTQALFGEPVHVRTERAGWVEVVLPWQPSSADPEGYPGWVPASHVADTDVTAYAHPVVVTTPVIAADGVSLSYGTILDQVDRSDSTARLALPGGGVVTVDAAALAPVPRNGDARDVPAMLDSARQFLGLRYLWGGTSGWGLDCSGFVHLVHRRFGITVPRDTFDQIEVTTPTETAVAGDLYFFHAGGDSITHVGFATNTAADDLVMLHAPDGERLQYIEEGPMAPTRREHLAGAGSFLG